MWIDIIFSILLIFSFIYGLKQGAIRSLFSLISIVVSIFLTNLLFKYSLNFFSFIGDTNWHGFVAFFALLILISVLLSLILLLPQKLLTSNTNEGLLSMSIGGFISIICILIFLVVLKLVTDVFPISIWFQNILNASLIVRWTVKYFNFVGFLMPNINVNLY